MALRDTLANAGYDPGKFMDGCALLYLQDPANFATETKGAGYPGKINDIVEINPADPNYGKANSANGWRYGGDSEGGLAINVSRETRVLESDQHRKAAVKHDVWNVGVSGNLVQFEVEAGTLDNLLAVWGGGTLSDIAGAVPAQKKVKLPLGSEIIYQRAALLYPHEYNSFERTLCIVLRKGAMKCTGDLSFVGNDQASLPFEIEAMPDDRDSVPTDEQRTYLLYAPGS
jgi:hypothetical protein